MIAVVPYAAGDAQAWDDFIQQAKNGHFFFHRSFLAYHGDRFRDASLLIFKKNKLVAVFVANRRKQTLYAHEGLTFGGLVWGEQLRLPDFFAVWEALWAYWQSEGIKHLIYRVPPAYQTRLPTDELLLVLAYLGGRCVRTELSPVCLLPPTTKPAQRKARNLKKANQAALSLAPLSDWRDFEAVLLTQLWERHGVKPVHNAFEMDYLSKRFPGQITHHGAFLGDGLVAGATLFINPYAHTRHVQYMAATPEGRCVGAMDYLIAQLLKAAADARARYFSFGVSSEAGGEQINAGLACWKEQWGAVHFLHQTYLLDLRRPARLLERLV
ncbi:MAG: GNAT family N-acetyltransferase [Bernardetiaceae bacterium]